MLQPNEQQEIDVDDLNDLDLKINPSYYIHKALIRAQLCLTREGEYKQGFAQYRALVEHLEVLCKASKLINREKEGEDDEGNYDKAIKDYKNSEEYKKISDETQKSMKISDKKLYHILLEVFDNKEITTPLTFK